MKLVFRLFCVVLFFATHSISGQTKEQVQVWGGLMTQIRMGKKSLLWNDFHFVAGGFLVARTGYTHEIKFGRLTAGLAHLWLPDGSQRFNRQEWRPWAQWFWAVKHGEKHQTQYRVRYEARFREKMLSGKVLDEEYNFNHRLRLQFTYRYNFLNISRKDKLFTALGAELLVNHGDKTYWLDQHRRNITLGVARRGIIFQTGYMNRQNLRDNGTVSQINHTWINWLILEF